MIVAAPEPSMVLVGKEPETLLEAVATTLEARLESGLMGPVPTPDTELIGIDPTLDMPLTGSEPSTVLVGKVPEATLDVVLVSLEIWLELDLTLTGPVTSLDTTLRGIIPVFDA